MMIDWCKKGFYFWLKCFFFGVKSSIVKRLSAKNDKTPNSRFLDLRSLRFKLYLGYQNFRKRLFTASKYLNLKILNLPFCRFELAPSFTSVGGQFSVFVLSY